MRSLEDVVGDLPVDHLLCPMRAVRVHLRCTEALRPRLCVLFVSPSCPSRSLSKIVLSYFVRRVIIASGAAGEGVSPRVLRVRGVATSVLFMRKWLVSISRFPGCSSPPLGNLTRFHFISFTRCFLSF